MEPSLIIADDQTELLDSFGFLEFLQIFFFGDYYLLASFLPKITRGLDSLEFSNPIDQFVEEPGRALEVHGNPLKNTMLIQTLRYMPLILSAPTIFIFGMVFVDLVILTKFVLHKLDKGNIDNSIKEEMELKTGKIYELHNVYVASSIDVNKRQNSSYLDSIERSSNERSYVRKVGDRLCDILVSISAKLMRLTINYDDEKNPDVSQEFDISRESYPDRYRRGNEIINAPIEDQVGDVDKDLRQLRTNLADQFPTVGVSFGTIIGMLFSYSFWGSLGVGPFGVITILAGMLGRSTSLLLDGLHYFFM